MNGSLKNDENVAQ